MGKLDMLYSITVKDTTLRGLGSSIWFPHAGGGLTGSGVLSKVSLFLPISLSLTVPQKEKKVTRNGGAMHILSPSNNLGDKTNK